MNLSLSASSVTRVVPLVFLVLVSGCGSPPETQQADTCVPDAADATLGTDAHAEDAASDPDAHVDDAASDADAPDGSIVVAPVPTNDTPTARTSALYALLMDHVGARSALFGQQYASWSGHDGRRDSFDSDVREALAGPLDTAADHPAVFGWSFETWVNGDAALRESLRARLIETDARGGINTLHWPMGNFLIECAAPPCGDNDNDPDVDPIALIATNAYVAVPYSDPVVYAYAGELFDAKVDALATFLASLRTASDEPIPIIVRPFHEMNNPHPGPTAHWWTGRDPTQYRVVFQRFVDRLRVTHGLRNLLFAFAPSAGHFLVGPDTPSALYARYWPETDPSSAAHRYVDVVGFDAYLNDSDPSSVLFDGIRTVDAFARAAERVVPRVSAIAETGRKNGTGSPSDGGPIDYRDGPFWTERVLAGLDADDGDLWRRFAYVMTWTNGTFSTYVGAPKAQADDFVAWFDAPGTLFLREVAPF